MKTPNPRREFVAKLLARDPPPPDKLRQHREVLFHKVRRRIVLYKLIVGTLYIALFLFAFWASSQQWHAQNITHSILWGAVSVYTLLWFLVWLLRGIYRGLARLANQEATDTPEWKRQDRFVTAAAVVVLVFGGFLLYRSFSLADPLRAAHQAIGCLWGTVFFLFWYPFGTASLVARVWLEHRKMELRLADGTEPDAEDGSERP